MIAPSRRVIVAVAVALVLSVILVPSARAAAPNLMMVYGGGMTEPIIIGDWKENHGFLLATSDPVGVSQAELAGRPYLSLALFWGPEWDKFVEAGGSLATLQPAQANQHGRFYPTYGPHQAILILTAWPSPGTLGRWASPQAAEVLRRHGIPAGPVAITIGSGIAAGALATSPRR